MKTFEQWWMKYYKIALLVGLVFLLFRLVFKGIDSMDAAWLVLFFAIITSPIGGVFGQILEWLFKLLKIVVKIIIEIIRLKRAGVKS